MKLQFRRAISSRARGLWLTAMAIAALTNVGLSQKSGSGVPIARTGPNSPTTGELFGKSLDADGDYVAIGTTGQGGRGEIDVLEWSNQGLMPHPSLDSTALAGLTGGHDSFGQGHSSVLIQGKTLVVGGSRLNDGKTGATGRGAVVLYDRDSAGNWGFDELLLAPLDHPFPPNNQAKGVRAFGFSVALEGDWLAVGAPESIPQGGLLSEGAVFVYHRQGGAWPTSPTWSLYHPDLPNKYDSRRFGYSVAIAGGRLVVGAPTDLANVGSIVEFSLSPTVDPQPGGTVHHVPSSANPAGFFGAAVSANGNTLIVGEPSGTTGPLPGRIWIAKWSPVLGGYQSYVPQIPAGSMFGAALSYEGQRIVVGAPGQTNLGSVWELIPTSGNKLTVVELKRSFSQGNWDELGKSVAQSSRGIFAGAPRSGLCFPCPGLVGLVWFFNTQAQVTSYCPAVPNSSGNQADLALGVAPNMLASSLPFSLTNAPSGRIGALLFGPTKASLPFWAGTLCVGPSIGVITPPFRVDASGAAFIDVDLNKPPFPIMYQPGITLHFQGVFRDVLGGANTSNGVELSVAF